ncbi:DUF2157 domain-containing protein [Leptolyngbya sp. 15MV]|nr:DUF2157 domain-containing protein [Leptolyngbya sp. 15MV]
MSERKLRAWREAGLIDGATAARILAWEADHARPLGLWAAIGIGALAIGLGVVSLVAANWEDVPGVVRLALHLVLIAALAAFIGWRGTQLEREHPWALEAALFVLAMLGMTFFGSLRPGITVRPPASITRVLVPASRTMSRSSPTATNRSPLIASARAEGREGSTVMTLALRTIRSIACEEVGPPSPRRATTPARQPSSPPAALARSSPPPSRRASRRVQPCLCSLMTVLQ